MKVFITGGAGFIGCNAADYFAAKGDDVVIFDNFSRQGTDLNAEWLKQKHGEKIQVVKGDIRTNLEQMKEGVKEADLVLHLAAQVAVTTSVKEPREDFEINALGTFNVLEAMRETNSKATLIYSSTNKVYGGMEDIEIIERNNRYEYKELPNGIPENRLLDFHSPYGCSKGCGDQYVRDYARIYGLNSVVMRQSCIYGPRQFGIEDQGWVAWFTIAAMLDKKITIYGDGKQIRDVLYIDDLIQAFELAHQKIKSVRGQVFNIGGGPGNTMSLLELIAFLEKFFNKKIDCGFSDWRPGDQPVYVSDVSKAEKVLGWQSTVGIEEGVKKLSQWVEGHKELFSHL